MTPCRKIIFSFGFIQYWILYLNGLIVTPFVRNFSVFNGRAVQQAYEVLLLTFILPFVPIKSNMSFVRTICELIKVVPLVSRAPPGGPWTGLLVKGIPLIVSGNHSCLNQSLSISVKIGRLRALIKSNMSIWCCRILASRRKLQ